MNEELTVNPFEETLPKSPKLLGKIGDSYANGETIVNEPPRSQVAFNDYVKMGKGRSLERLAQDYCQPENQNWTDNFESVYRQLKEYSRKFGWQQRLRAIITKASTEALAEAQREAFLHTKARIELSVKAQLAGIKVIEAAQLDNLTVEEARKLLKPATALLQLGLASERAEAGDNLASIRPDKNPRDMTDEELEEYAATLNRSLQ